ncbi:group II intron reverse transcriptase/maturase [Leptolyngbya sp. CCNP1308]|uniref:group II intron reverse transcriptase/maturase n=1 Tax=Leptolyngbya sp. CCNP1308 TaxID=3110255 RepID=UPI002B200AFA|nr:group II intron reverse transcriptase/maturase [Leptolyngbya sp. CCNP1308]MEA5451903.1 group II intron reverse transcriptase/maturase [Leptolyngbya sp. CCNP1308]
MNTSFTTMYEWHSLPWRKLERQVYKLQTRIYRASRRGDVKTVHRLQRLLLKSWAARCLAVRRVSQDNQGKRTAGVDGVKSLNPVRRILLVKRLRLTDKAQPTRRVWIPKPGKEEKRPLGIPTMADRARQALLKLALEPEWEARFEPNSYGFRPGRSAHDAIEAIFNCIRMTPKYVLDADISQCFDRISHQALLQELNAPPLIRRQVRAWLKGGVMESGQWFPTEEGTPQRGVISPLLANIALHGMENRIKQVSPKAHLIRYADDFVILHEQLEVIQACQQAIVSWLAERGLALQPSKTRYTHTLHPYQGNVGFDFLGFTVRQNRVGKHQSKSHLGHKTLITPSKANLKRHLAQVRSIIQAYRAAPQSALIRALNPVIRGWTNYDASGVRKKTFQKAQWQTFWKLWRWATRRHSNKSRQWVARQYWHQSQFSTSDGKSRLINHQDTAIRRHVKVKADRSPYDGDWLYWSQRLGKHLELPTRVAVLLKRQSGKCPACGLYFRAEDRMEVDHVLPLCQGGGNRYSNLQLLHRHCHDNKTLSDLRRSALSRHCIVEELDEGKLSRLVLKTSR